LSHKPSTKTTTPPATSRHQQAAINAESTATQHTKDQTTHTPTPHPQQAEDKKHAHLYVCSTKLLQKHPTHPHTPNPSPQREGNQDHATHARCFRCSRPLFNNQTPHPPTPPAQPPGQTDSKGSQRNRVIPQDPTVCQPLLPHQPARFHTHPRHPHRDTQNKQY
jgi:hypothetical protein